MEKKSTQKIVRRRRTGQSYPSRLLYVQSLPSILVPKILPASDSERRPRRSSGGPPVYIDPSRERQRAPSTPRWVPSSLQRSFRRAIASSVHAAAVGSALPTQILPASDSEYRPRRSSGVRLAYIDISVERQRAPSTPRWGPFSLQRSFRRAIASSVHTCF